MILLKVITLTLIFTSLSYAEEVDQSTMNASEGNQWRLSWSDEFNYEGRPSEENWSYITGYTGFNQELQRYTDSLKNAFVRDGVLRIEAHCDRVSSKEFREIEETIRSYGGNPDDLRRQEVTSARLVSYGKRDFSNAKVQVRARFSDDRGSWPAIWLLGDESKNRWPTCGEIDIMEHVGYDPNIIHSSVHTKDYNFMKRNNATETTKVRSVKSWHVYEVEWSDSEIIFSIDGKAYHTLERGDRDDVNWPFLKDDQYHVILNIAVGGSWGGIKGVDTRAFPYYMEVDYVRVFERVN
jgi:beta-glucanase (GH16 family)